MSRRRTPAAAPTWRRLVRAICIPEWRPAPRREKIGGPFSRWVSRRHLPVFSADWRLSLAAQVGILLGQTGFAEAAIHLRQQGVDLEINDHVGRVGAAGGLFRIAARLGIIFQP